MKTALLIAVTLLLSLTVFAQSTYDKATVTGTVQTGVKIADEDIRIRAEPLNNKRIFQEFAVSPEAYELVLNPSTYELLLLPKHASAGLPTIVVFAPGDTFLGLTDTKAKLDRFSANFALSPHTNLFKDLSGQMVIVRYYKGKFPDFVVKKNVLNALAQSSPPRDGNNTTFLKIKVTASVAFTQAP